MLNREIIFGVADLITPDLAAKIAQTVSVYNAKVYIKHRGIELCVDSLIGILAMNIHRGSKVEIGAEGAQAEEALDAICTLLV